MRKLIPMAVAAIALLVVVPSSAQAWGETCHGDLTVDGKRKHSMKAAKYAAIHAWEHAANRKYGPAYDGWYHSGDRLISCDWDKAARHFWCLARARPCGPY